MKYRWIAATALVLASGCGSRPNGPDPAQPATPPQIACPTDVSLGGVTGSSQTVTFSAPTVTGGAAPVKVSCTPASGDSFPLGTTSVSCAATDTQTRQATCSFNVSLTGFAIAVTKYDAFGDSLTEGQNASLTARIVDGPNAYPTKLQLEFDSTYPGQGVAVINRGHSGDSVEQTVENLKSNLPRDRPGAVLILTGYNNLLSGGCRLADGNNPACNNAIDAVRLGVRDCIRRSKEAPANVPFVFVSTLTPPGPRVAGVIDRRLRGDSIVQVNAQIQQVVAAEGGILVDPYPLFIGHEADYVDGDGLHLRPAGYQVLADTFFAAITARIPQSQLFGFRRPR